MLYFIYLSTFFCKTIGRSGSYAFVSKSFVYWRKVDDRIYCPLLGHVRNENSPHRIAMKCCEDLINQSRDITNLVDKRAS